MKITKKTMINSEKIDFIYREIQVIKAAIEKLFPPLPKTMLLTEVMNTLKLSRSRIYRLIYEKKILPIQNGKHGKIMFTEKELIRYLKSREKR